MFMFVGNKERDNWREREIDGELGRENVIERKRESWRKRERDRDRERVGERERWRERKKNNKRKKVSKREKERERGKYGRQRNRRGKRIKGGLYCGREKCDIQNISDMYQFNVLENGLKISCFNMIFFLSYKTCSS